MQQEGWKQFQVMTVRPCWLSGGELLFRKWDNVALFTKMSFFTFKTGTLLVTKQEVFHLLSEGTAHIPSWTLSNDIIALGH